MGLLDFLRGRRPPPPPASPLRPDGLLVSDLLVDRPDALEEIDRRLAAGKLRAEEAEHLRRFSRDGYTVVELDLDAGVYGAMDAAVERLWQERPDDVAYAYQGHLTRFSHSLPEHRAPSYRIADLHSADATALGLFLHPRLFSLVSLIFGEPAVALQSLYFEWGSQQALHRDPVHVMTWPPSHLIAAWIALEDIGPDCGPLVYVPGSHRLPYYQYEPGRYLFNHDLYGAEEARASEAWDRDQCERHGLKPIPFTAKRGQAFLWHHSLLHGGSIPTDPALTRKSFVIHYSTRSTMKRVLNSYREWNQPDREGDSQVVVRESSRLLEQGERAGFASPLAEPESE